VSTAGTPYAAVYDATHNLIFSSNPDWNRVDVISNATHKIVKSIPIRSPRGIDITQDRAHVWVQTASRNLYEINTSSLQANQYSLPAGPVSSSGLSVQFSGDTLQALSDGTLFVFFDDSGSGGGGQAGVWNPQTNHLDVLASGVITAFGFPVRSGDGTRVYASNNTYDSGMEVYDTSAQTLSTLNHGTGYPKVAAVNSDGSELILSTNTSIGLYDHNLNLLGTLPGEQGVGGGLPLYGGVLFSPGNTKIYEIGEIGPLDGLTVDLTIDTASLKILGTAPASLTNPVGTSGYAGTPTPFAVDVTGMLLGLQNYGISFEDSTFYQNYSVNQPGSNNLGGVSTPCAGPLAGGTVCSLYVFPPLIPDVWFGQTRGSTSLTQQPAQGQLSFTSPAGTIPGPVNVKFIYPDGTEGFYPEFFSYLTFPQYAVMSGSSPNGGAPAQVIGYGLPEEIPAIQRRALTNEFGIAISADGNVVGANNILGDVSLNMFGSVGFPIPFYGAPYSSEYPPSLYRPRLNASGSLYYFSYPNFFEIIDVAHANLRMRFSLTETIQNAVSPLAIDSGGRYVYLITDKGLTVVDLGAAPLSIGRLSQQTASPGTQVVVRGSGFDSGTTATVGGLPATLSFTDENTLTLTVPRHLQDPKT
jgi:hypothetical protein